MSDKTLALSLRKLAAELRKEAQAQEQRKVVKCAQILVATKGLRVLKEQQEGALHV